MNVNEPERDAMQPEEADNPLGEVAYVQPEQSPNLSQLPPSYNNAQIDPQQTGSIMQPAQILCPSCHGGNAPDAKTCMWCNQPIDRARVAQAGTQGLYMPTNQQALNPQSYQQTQPQQQYANPQAHGYQQPMHQYPPATQVNVVMNNTQGTVIMVPQKSIAVSLLLTFLFGPLGMFYSTVIGAVIMIVAALMLGIVTAGCGLVLIWPISMIWGVVAASSYNSRAATAR